MSEELNKKSPSRQSVDKPDCGSSREDSKNKPTGSTPIEIKPIHSSSRAGLSLPRSSPESSSNVLVGSDGQPIPIDSIIKTANTMSSMMMAHKIALEDDFRLEPGMDLSGPLMSLSPIIGSSSPNSSVSGTKTSEPTLHSKVKDIVHEAYWDLFKEELNSHRNEDIEERKFDISKQLLRDIKQKIIDLLLPQHTRLKQDLEDRLDSQILDQLSKVDSLNLVDYAKYILSVLSKLCAPVRDERLRELNDTTDVVQLFRGILELLEMMRLDFANFTLSRFKPHIKAHSQNYEREKFNEILKQQQSIGIDGLEYTRIWLQRAAERLDATQGLAELVDNNSSTYVDQEDLNPTGSNMIEVSAVKKDYSLRDKILKSELINKILNSAYCELLDWSNEKQRLYPEALLFDEATFKQLEEQYKALVMISSVLLTSFAFCNKIKLQDSNEFRSLIKSHVISLMTVAYDKPNPGASELNNLVEGIDRVKLESIVAKLCCDIQQRLEETDNKSAIDQFESQKETFKRQILDLESSSNRIRELARRRILEFVETLLTLDVQHQQKQFSTKMAPPVNIPLGLNCLADELTLTMAQLVKIIRYNRKVFFLHYQDIIVDVVERLLK